MEAPEQKPFVIRIYRGEESHQLRVYIWNLTPGGRGRDPDEYRIQITGFSQFENHPPEKTLILGWWEEAGVFAGWDYAKHSGTLGGSPSFQIKEQNLREAYLNGFSPYTKGNGEVAIGFRPDFFVTYVQQLEQLHGFGGSAPDFQVLERFAQHPLELNTLPLEQVSTPRKTAIIQLNKKLRDSSFKARVLTAYGHQCAFSGMQLKLVDAAHIIPVNSALSTDDTANGIALSALYHRAYDRGLVTFDEEYRIVTNDKELFKLQEMGYDGGMESFRKSLRPLINFPPALSDRPNVTMVKEANRLRGWVS
ncbi:MAG: HNH endonuclease [Flavobacteriales bacterium]|nr:HNH endonuclease [Flavobacteriales bacterium]